MTALSDPRDLPALLGVPLSDEQLRAATAPLAPQLIVAGAGTGKTTVMAARVVWLVGTGQVQPQEMLGLTFTNKATAELRHRVRVAIARLRLDADADSGEPVVLTYHAFAGQVVAEHGPLLGVESDSRLLGDGQRARLAYRVACDPRHPDGLTGSPDLAAERLLAMDDILADLDIGADELTAYDTDLLARLGQTQGPARVLADMTAAAQQRLVTAQLVAQFREAKLAGEWVDFADQVRLGSELAHAVPAVGDTLRRTFRVVLLDEYQDTSRAQRRMLQALFGGGHPVTAVGDPCQAIYGWRGASVTNIDEFPRHFPAADTTPAQVDELTVNRRSRPAVLAAGNEVAAGLRAFHTMVRPLRPPAGHDGGELTCALLPTWDEELHWLGSQLADVGARRDWGDIAVLCRSNDQVAAVVDHLRDRRIPAHVSSRRDLLALPEVAAVTSALRVLVDPHANPELIQHLTGPRWRIGPRDLAILGRRAKDLALTAAGLAPDDPGAGDVPVSLVDAVASPGPTATYRYSTQALTRFVELARELDWLDRLRDRPVADVVAAAGELLGPSLVGLADTELPASLAALVGLAQGFRGMAGERDLAAFVAYLDDCLRFGLSPQDETFAPGPGITVMTVHAAKGLEFPVVALPFLSAGVFPDARSARWVTSARAVPPVATDEPDPAIALGFPGAAFTTKEHQAYVEACRFDDRLDEDRLAYVAVTRAKDAVIASGHWWGPTQTRPRGPSPYLLQIRAACEASEGVVGPWSDDPGDRPKPTADQHRPVGVPWPSPAVRPEVADLIDRLRAAPQPDDDNPWLPVIAAVTATADIPVGDEPLPAVVSASGLAAWLGAPDRFLAELRRPMPRRPTAAAAAGAAFHSWIEHRAGQQVLFDLPGEGATGELDTDAYERLLARTRFADRTPHAVEAPFVLGVDGLVITGRIDAVFPVADDPDADWEVVDWKTGNPDRADPVQLAVYRSAWARQQGVPEHRVRATFVFLSDGSERSYDDLDPVEDVVARLTRELSPVADA